jgi:hypothetical protein
MATQTRVPTGAGDTNNYSFASGGSDHYLEVDDPVGTPDDSTTYVSAVAVNGRIELFTFAAFSISSSAIASVAVKSRMQRIGSNTAAHRLKVNGTVYVGASASPGLSWADASETWLTNPDTGIGWTEADVEGTGANPIQQFGFSSAGVGVGEESQCTQCYCEVDYTAGGAAAPKTLMMMGVG